MLTAQMEKKVQNEEEVQTIHFHDQLELNRHRQRERDKKVSQIFGEIDDILNELNIDDRKTS